MPELPSHSVSIEPREGEDYAGRQWGYSILVDGELYARAWTGGTGDCWNFQLGRDEQDIEYVEQLHACELSKLAAALSALLGSEAHREHVKRWA